MCVQRAPHAPRDLPPGRTDLTWHVLLLLGVSPFSHPGSSSARAAGISLAATPAATRLHTDVDLTGAVAIAVGTEKEGLTDEALAAADLLIRIPMSGKANSLNVATSAAIVLYEAVRQR